MNGLIVWYLNELEMLLILHGMVFQKGTRGSNVYLQVVIEFGVKRENDSEF